MKKIKKIIKRKLFSSGRGTLLFYKIRILREKWALMTLSDYAYIKKEYKKRCGKEINLKNPQTISEKLNWLKLFYRNDQMSICSDKYDLRIYLRKYGYEHLLNEVIGLYESEEEIDQMDIESLPKSFVAKATHGSSWNLIVKDKSEINWKLWKKIFKLWLKLDLSVFGREWHYRNIKPRILIEKFIDHSPLIDYKFYCFHGVPKFLSVNNEIDQEKHVDFYDLDWQKMDLVSKEFKESNIIIKKPKRFDDMLEIARDLSQEFPFVRVDFYNFDDTIIIGELTFFYGGGFNLLLSKTKNYEKIYGSHIKLPEPNHNLKLYKKIQAQ